MWLLPGLQDTNKVLAISRIMVAWQPLGLAMGTYDMCNRYLQQRQQFGSPLAAFQVELCTDVKEERLIFLEYVKTAVCEVADRKLLSHMR